MADAPDRDSQTEEASEKKLSDAMDRGVVPHSQEVSVLAGLAAMLVIAIFILPGAVGKLMAMLVHFIDDPGGWIIDDAGDARSLAVVVLSNVGFCLLPVAVILILFGLCASFAQNAPRMVLDRIRPQFSRISIRQGASRVFGLHGLTTFLKNVFKFASVTIIATLVVSSHDIEITNSIYLDVGNLPWRISDLIIRVLAGLVVAALVVAAVDLVWARIHWRSGQKMSRQEVKEEQKEAEGDPLLKARLRSIRMDRARKRMLTAVPKATMVVVNPTHYAVAMRYVRGEGGVPIVVAKGMDLVALRIREIAEENHIPVIEDKPLARSLYAVVKVDRAIPSEFYRAVAEIIHLIHKKNANKSLERESRQS
jgi:flagellar biosynthetic protein FlhB